MPNNIPQDQNTNQNLRHFVASRRWYARGQRIACLQMLIAVFLPLGSAVTLVWSQTPATKIWVTFFGISAAMVEGVIMEPYQRRYRTNGANEQEVFDCAVLRLPWPNGLAGNRPSPETTQEVVQSWKEKDSVFDRFKNWYPQGIQDLPLAFAQLVCQRCNAWWDSELRRRYAGSLRGIAIGVIVLVLAVGLYQSRKPKDLILTVYAPLFPLVMWGLKEHQRHAETAAFSARLTARVDEIWHQAINGHLTETEISRETRDLQDAIYYRRRTAPFLPNWIQRWQQRRYFDWMMAGVEEKVAQAMQAQSGNKLKRIQDAGG